MNLLEKHGSDAENGDATFFHSNFLSSYFVTGKRLRHHFGLLFSRLNHCPVFCSRGAS
jgi:hypothetical protein